MRTAVVIPSYNRRHTLARALDSVLAQTLPAAEIIVVDDGSSDGTAALVEARYPSVRLLRQPNRGVSAARNRGIAASECDWIALLDSDDCWRADKLERVSEAARADPDAVLIHSDETWIRRGRRVNPMHKHKKRGGWIFEHCLPLCAISPSATVLRKATVDALGGFDESLPACEDYDLWLRLCCRHPVHYIDAPLVIRYAGHDDQLSARFVAMDRFRVRALDRLLSGTELEPAQYRAARDTLLEKLDILLGGARKHGNRPILDEFTPLVERYRAATGAGAC